MAELERARAPPACGFQKKTFGVSHHFKPLRSLEGELSTPHAGARAQCHSGGSGLAPDTSTNTTGQHYYQSSTSGPTPSALRRRMSSNNTPSGSATNAYS